MHTLLCTYVYVRRYIHASYVHKSHIYTLHACLQTPEHQLAGRVSPGPAPGTLKRILLHDDYEDESLRARVASVSGRPVVQKGMAIVIGESSSESEDEDDEEGEDSTGEP